MGTKVTLEEAQTKVPYRIMLADIPGAALKNVSIGGCDCPDEHVVLVYDDGTGIEYAPTTLQPNLTDNPRATALTVRGRIGISRKPDSRWVVEWWENGLTIEVIGRRPVAELVRIANSLR